MPQRSARISIAVLAAVLALAPGCEQEAQATGYRKEFRLVERLLEERTQLFHVYKGRFPETLEELVEPGKSGFKLPELPPGYFFDYSNEKGTVRVRPEAERKNPEAE